MTAEQSTPSTPDLEGLKSVLNKLDGWVRSLRAWSVEKSESLAARRRHKIEAEILEATIGHLNTLRARGARLEGELANSKARHAETEKDACAQSSTREAAEAKVRELEPRLKTHVAAHRELRASLTARDTRIAAQDAELADLREQLKAAQS